MIKNIIVGIAALFFSSSVFANSYNCKLTVGGLPPKVVYENVLSQKAAMVEQGEYICLGRYVSEDKSKILILSRNSGEFNEQETDSLEIVMVASQGDMLDSVSCSCGLD